MSKTITRVGDMHPKTALNVHLQDDGDIVVWVGHPLFPIDGGIDENSVEFTTIGSGGGRSEKTLGALRNLIKAMEEDNRNCQIF
jgi:hypothetical protein